MVRCDVIVMPNPLSLCCASLSSIVVHPATTKSHMATAKIIYGTAWLEHIPTPVYLLGSDSHRELRKKERTTALVVSAVLHGFRAIDTGA